MFVRTASERDLEAIRALLVETWHATYDCIYGVERVNAITDDWHSVPALKEQMARPNSEFIVADDGSRLGGMAFADFDPDLKRVFLRQLYVSPASQGSGVGGTLMEEVLASFPEASSVTLEVEEANARAVRFYESFGFAQSGRTANCGKAQSGIPAITMDLRLPTER